MKAGFTSSFHFGFLSFRPHSSSQHEQTHIHRCCCAKTHPLDDQSQERVNTWCTLFCQSLLLFSAFVGNISPSYHIMSKEKVATTTTPIAELRLHHTNWTIQARITSKSDVRSWSNNKGQGKFFWIELMDASSITIRATFFRDAVDQFYPKLHADDNKIYTFSAGRLKLANKKYNRSCKSNLEIIFDKRSEIRSDPSASAVVPPHSSTRGNVASLRHQERNDVMPGTSSGVIQTGDWRKELQIKVQAAPVWREKEEHTAFTLTPIQYDKTLTDDERTEMRDRRAAAAEARFQKTSRKTQKKKKKAALISPFSSPRMRFTSDTAFKRF